MSGKYYYRWKLSDEVETHTSDKRLGDLHEAIKAARRSMRSDLFTYDWLEVWWNDAIAWRSTNHEITP